MDSTSTQSNSSYLYEVPGIMAELCAQSEKGFFGWLTPTLGEVAIECKSAMPKFLFSMWTGRSKNIDEKATTEPGSGVFEQDLKWVSF